MMDDRAKIRGIFEVRKCSMSAEVNESPTHRLKNKYRRHSSYHNHNSWGQVSTAKHVHVHPAYRYGIINICHYVIVILCGMGIGDQLFRGRRTDTEASLRSMPPTMDISCSTNHDIKKKNISQKGLRRIRLVMVFSIIDVDAIQKSHLHRTIERSLS